MNYRQNNIDRLCGEVELISNFLILLDWVAIPIGLILMYINDAHAISSILEFAIAIFILLIIATKLVLPILYIVLVWVFSLLVINIKNNNTIMYLSNLLHTLFFTLWAFIAFFAIYSMYPKQNPGNLILLYPVITIPIALTCKIDDSSITKFMYVYCLKISTALCIIIVTFFNIINVKIFLIILSLLLFFTMLRYTEVLISEGYYDNLE